MCTVALEVASKRGPLVGFAHFTSGGFVVITESASEVSGSNKYQIPVCVSAEQITYDIKINYNMERY